MERVERDKWGEEHKKSKKSEDEEHWLYLKPLSGGGV